MKYGLRLLSLIVITAFMVEGATISSTRVEADSAFTPIELAMFCENCFWEYTIFPPFKRHRFDIEGEVGNDYLGPFHYEWVSRECSFEHAYCGPEEELLALEVAPSSSVLTQFVKDRLPDLQVVHLDGLMMLMDPCDPRTVIISSPESGVDGDFR